MAMQKQRYVSLAWLPTKANVVVVRVYKHMSTDILAAGRKIQIKYISPFSCSPPSLFFPGLQNCSARSLPEREKEKNQIVYFIITSEREWEKIKQYFFFFFFFYFHSSSDWVLYVNQCRDHATGEKRRRCLVVPRSSFSAFHFTMSVFLACSWQTFGLK